MTAAPSTTTAVPASKALNVTLWVLQMLLAAFFLMAGYTHGIMPIAEAAQRAVWMADVPPLLTRFIGIAELAGALGLIIPAATRRAPWLTPLAAVGLAVIMILAVPFHISRGEAAVTPFNIVVALVAAFVAWGRFKEAPIAPR